METMDKTLDPEFVFRLGAEAMRYHIAAWAESNGLTPVAIDVLNIAPPGFSRPEAMTIATAPYCNCHLHKSGKSTGGWKCQAHGQQL
jgi:hypothetical protein